jgi:DNA polymerase (family 10)
MPAVVFSSGQAHNIALRERAVKMGINISEYGLAKAGTGDYKPLATEEALYSRLGLAYIPPELREDSGEIDAADSGRLPDLVSVEDIRGDERAKDGLLGVREFGRVGSAGFHGRLLSGLDRGQGVTSDRFSDTL